MNQFKLKYFVDGPGHSEEIRSADDRERFFFVASGGFGVPTPTVRLAELLIAHFNGLPIETRSKYFYPDCRHNGNCAE